MRLQQEIRFCRLVLPYLPRYWKRLGLGILFLGLTALANGLQIGLIRLVLDHLIPTEPVVVLPGTDASFLDRLQAWTVRFAIEPFSTDPYDVFLILAVLVVFLYAMKGIFDYLGNYLTLWVTEKFLQDFRNDLFRHISGLSLDFFSGEGTGGLMSRVVNDVEQLRTSLRVWTQLVAEPLTIAALVTFALAINVRMTLIAIAIMPVAGIVIAIIGKRVQRARKEAQKRLGDLSQGLSQSFSSIRIVKTFGAEEFERNQFAERTRKLFGEFMRIVRYREMSGPIMEFLGSLGVAFILIIGGYFVIREKSFDGKDFVSLVTALGLMYQPIKRLSSSYNNFQQAVAAGDRIQEIYDIQPSVVDRPNAVEIHGLNERIEYKNVSFSYDHGRSWALREVAFTALKGQVVALVGPSGAGKSTLVDLLGRFYDVSEGAIQLDGRDIRDVTIRSLRRQIAVVPQEMHLFNDTVAANIAYGRPEASQEDIEQAARRAQAHDFIRNLPEGYQTIVGERGTALSGGQAQRLAIARALMKNAPILILDEATSSLDPESELAVKMALEELIEQHTTFVIAHRLSTVLHADRILVLDQGRIVSQGSHRELLERSPLYRRLYELQFDDKTKEPHPGKDVR